ncbi:ketosteroid isomerase-like protein [Rhizobium pisi]
MADHTGRAAAIARTYVEAIANKDIDTILEVSTEDVACASPIGKLTGAPAFRGFDRRRTGFGYVLKPGFTLPPLSFPKRR